MTYDSAFRYIVGRVGAMKPGQSLLVSARVIEPPKAAAIASFIEMMSGGFTQADRVLENIVSASVTHYYRREGHDIRYFRLHTELPESVRSYASPDRRHRLRERPDGLYEHYDAPPSELDERLILCALRGHRWGPGQRHPKREELPLVSSWSPNDAENMTYQLIACEYCERCAVTRDQPTPD